MKHVSFPPVKSLLKQGPYYTLLLLAVLFYFAGSSTISAEGDELARVGRSVITAREFAERYELTPWPRGEKHPDMDMLKKDFLYTLVAEKLWAQRGLELRYDTTEVMRYSFSVIEKMYVRDALFKLEISDKVKIPEKELLKGYFRNTVSLKLDFIFSKDIDEIAGTYEMLQKGVPFDSLLAYRNNPLDSTLDVAFGQVDERLEDTLYNLKPGQYTTPFNSPEGYYIFRVKERIEQPLGDARGEKNAMSKVKKIIQDRLREKVYQKYYTNFFAGKKINANGFILWSLAEKVADALGEAETREKDKEKKSDKIVLQTEDFLKIESRFGADSLALPFIEFDRDPVSLKQFLREFMAEGFYSNTAEPAAVRAKINSRVKRFIELELLAREGYKRGLQNLPEVKQSLQMWRDFYLAQLAKSSLFDSTKAGDEEARKYYETHNSEITLPVQVNIIEVLTDNLGVVEKVLDELKNNADMRELARKYTMRELTRGKGGEFGLFPVTEYGEIGRIASTMRVGEVYGPLKVPEGYSVFKLIDKKEETKKKPTSFEEVKDNVKQNLHSFKYQRDIRNMTARLADKYGVTVDEKALNSVQLNNLTMIAYRLMGFGGRITAVPLTAPFSDWTELWRNKTELP